MAMEAPHYAIESAKALIRLGNPTMAIRMPSARKMPYLTDLEAGQVDADQKPRDQYCCMHCTATVFFRKKHLRNGRFVDAIFYSHNHHPHGENCRFNVPAVIRNAVHRSKQFGESGRIVEDDGGIVLRLKMFDDIIRRLRKELPPNTSESVLEIRSADALQIEDRYNPYLRGAGDIIRLMSASDDYEDISRFLHLDCNGKRIEWRNFYYGIGELDRLYNYLDTGNVDHPVFAVLHVNKIIHWKGNKNVFAYSEQVFPPDGTGVKIVPALLSENPLVFNTIVKNQFIGVCATARIDGRGIGDTGFSRLVFDVSSLIQLAKYPV